jgi:hypothetical protein
VAASNKEKILVRLAVPVFFGLLVGVPFIKQGFHETWDYVGNDFEIFLEASKDLGAGRSPYPENLSVLASEDLPGLGWGGYIYPALFARLLLPLTAFPPLLAKRIYLMVCLLLFLALLFPILSDWKRRTAGAFLAGALLLGWGPVIQNFRFAQSNFFALFLIAGAFLLLREDSEPKPDWSRRLAAGALFGLAASLKLTPLLLLPVLALCGAWTLLIGVCGGFLGGLLLSGPASTWEFLTVVLPSLSRLPDHPEALSLPTLLDRATMAWLGKGYGPVLVGFLFLLLLVWVLRHRENLAEKNLLLLGAYLPTVFAGVWYHHYILAVLPLSVYLLGKDWLPLRRRKGSSYLLVLLLLPGFDYWAPVKAAFDRLGEMTGVSLPTLFVLGHGGAFLLWLRALPSSGESHPADIPLPAPDERPVASSSC